MVIQAYTVPLDWSSAIPIEAVITDMADLSVTSVSWTEPTPGETLEIFLPGKYDNNYRVEIFKGEVIDSILLDEEYYEIVRPYVDPNTLGTTASEIAEYTTLELVARSMIDTFCPEGFYNKKVTVIGTGNGSDYFSLWEKVYRVFKVYENNQLVYDRSTPELNEHEYSITSDKTAIQKIRDGVVNRYESTAQNLPVASGDLAY